MEIWKRVYAGGATEKVFGAVVFDEISISVDNYALPIGKKVCSYMRQSIDSTQSPLLLSGTYALISVYGPQGDE
jgi:hypothetical protein